MAPYAEKGRTLAMVGTPITTATIAINAAAACALPGGVLLLAAAIIMMLTAIIITLLLMRGREQPSPGCL